MTFEPVGGTYLNYDENACDRQSTCYQTVLSFQIWLREMFSDLICPGLMESSNKSAAVHITAVFGTREHVDSRK